MLAADLPDDAIRVVLAAVVPCPFCDGSGNPPEGGGRLCGHCHGTGERERRVVTDVEVEPAVFADDSGGTIRSPSNMRTTVWREVPHD